MIRITQPSVPGYLGKRISEGEHQQQDFKFAINNARKIAETLSAFANTDGGRLLIGVKDNGRIAGVRNDEEMYMVEGAADLYCKPPVALEFQVWEYDIKRVLEVWVNASPMRPHKAKTEDDTWKAYIRVNDENFLASPIHLHCWAHEDQSRKPPGTFTPDQQELFNAARGKSMTLNQLCKQVNMPRRQITQSLGDFYRWNLIHLARDKGKWIIKI